MLHQKILDSSREFIQEFDNKEAHNHLGFISVDGDDDDDDPLEKLDEFISKIATMLVSLLEGKEDLQIL